MPKTVLDARSSPTPPRALMRQTDAWQMLLDLPDEGYLVIHEDGMAAVELPSPTAIGKQGP